MLIETILHVLGCGVYVVIAVVLWMGFAPVKRFRFRHIPGPFGWPFIGNLMPLIRLYTHNYLSILKEQYGPVFKIWHGTQPWVIICEPDTVRKVAYKLNNHGMIPHALLGEERFVLEHVLLLLKDEEWRLMKKAWDPAVLHGASLVGYAPLMQECAEQLLERLEGVRQRGEVVDIHTELNKMTLDVVGSCAFGIRFHSNAAKSSSSSSSDEGARLQELCAQFFRCQELDNASKWVVPVLMLPTLGDVFRHLAYLLPDKGHRLLVDAIRGIKLSATKIIHASRAQRERGEQATASSSPTDAASDTTAPSSMADSPATVAAAAPPQPARAGRGVLPGSFVAQLEAWKAKHSGAVEVSDNLIAAQVMTFLLAGYETTGNALAFLVYQLAVNPGAQERLQQELDEVLGGRKATLEDLPKLPFLDACIKETLRINNPTIMFGRRYDWTPGIPATLNLLGKTIPKGAHIMSFPYGIHHDPQYWAQPGEFLPQRFLPETGGKLGPFNENAYIPFGSGGRKCVGYKFAEQEMMLVGAALFQRFAFTRPAGEGPVKGRHGLTLAPIGGVKVLVHGRSELGGGSAVGE